MTSPVDEVMLPIRVSPRADRTGIEGVVAGRLRIRVTASPVDGAANAAAVRLIAETLGVPPSSVRVALGVTGRLKVVAIQGLGRASLLARWPDLGV